MVWLICWTKAIVVMSHRAADWVPEIVGGTKLLWCLYGLDLDCWVRKENGLSASA